MIFKNQVAKCVLNSLYYLDQSLRLLLYKTKNNLCRHLIWYAIKTLDLFNTRALQLLIKIHGWPDTRLVGKRAGDTVYYILMHSDRTIIDKNLNGFSCAVASGKACKIHLCHLIDRALMHRGKKQIFGSEMREINLDGKATVFIYPIINRQAVNRRRSKSGFAEPIEIYAKNNNAVLDYDDKIALRLTKNIRN